MSFILSFSLRRCNQCYRCHPAITSSTSEEQYQWGWSFISKDRLSLFPGIGLDSQTTHLLERLIVYLGQFTCHLFQCPQSHRLTPIALPFVAICSCHRVRGDCKSRWTHNFVDTCMASKWPLCLLVVWLFHTSGQIKSPLSGGVSLEEVKWWALVDWLTG